MTTKLFLTILQSLLFEKLAEHHSGKYTCTARNSAAVTNYTASLEVHVSNRDNELTYGICLIVSK